MNTIYDGSFVLGSTNELTFSAGQGIKIDSPSEGVVRIGNDETVLYSGDSNITTGALSEPYYNFETIKVTFRDEASTTAYAGGILVGFMDSEDILNGNNGRSGCAVITLHNFQQAAAMGLRFGAIYLTSPTTFSSFKGEKAFTSTGAPTTVNNLWPTRVVGINRISGGNE